MRIIICIAVVLVFSVADAASIRVVINPAQNNRIISVLGPTDPAPANTVTVDDGGVAKGELAKYRVNGSTLEKRPTAELEVEYSDEWLAGFEAKIDSMNLNAADVKNILKFIVRRQEALERILRKRLELE